MKTQDTRKQVDRRKARKFARAAKHVGFWQDAPFAIRDRPRVGKGAR